MTHTHLILEKYSNIEIFSSNKSIRLLICIIIKTDNKNKDKKEKWNSIVLKPLNPNVGLEDDTVKRKLFPTDEKFHELVCSDKFKELIQTDASTEEGQQRVAEYYDVKEAWEKSMASQKSNDDMSPSDTYYQLLKAVKCVSKRDNV